MDFGEVGAAKLTIRASAWNGNGANSIRLNFAEKELLIEFEESYCFTERVFEFKENERLFGKGNLRFTFLPGSCFNFSWFKFENS
jgi:beta-galactosidase